MTPPPPSLTPSPADLGRLLTELNDRANRGDRSALAELEELLDRHQVVWQTAARLATDTAVGWARLVGDGGPVTEACVRREIAAWKAGLAGPDPSPLVSAAVDAAAVAWMAQRHAERETFRADVKKRTAAARQLATANRQLQDSIKLIIAARATVDATASEATDPASTATRPRLFDGPAAG